MICQIEAGLTGHFVDKNTRGCHCKDENAHSQLLLVRTIVLLYFTFFRSLLTFATWFNCESVDYSFCHIPSIWPSSPALHLYYSCGHGLAEAGGTRVHFCRIHAHLPRPLQYQQITLNRISLAFFLFSVIDCFVQGIIHSLLYSMDMDTSALVTSIIQEANVSRREIAWLNGDSKEFKLQLCTDIPFGKTDNFCTSVFDSRQGNVSAPVPTGFRRWVCCLFFFFFFFRLGHCSFIKQVDSAVKLFYSTGIGSN
jgi:hypothetical protein